MRCCGLGRLIQIPRAQLAGRDDDGRKKKVRVHDNCHSALPIACAYKTGKEGQKIKKGKKREEEEEEETWVADDANNGFSHTQHLNSLDIFCCADKSKKRKKKRKE